MSSPSSPLGGDVLFDYLKDCLGEESVALGPRGPGLHLGREVMECTKSYWNH